jgi:hypothetical protein
MDTRIRPASPSPSPKDRCVVQGEGFSGWQALNDTVMGGRSSGQCSWGPAGLRFTGNLVEEGGGFISVRSPLFSPPLDLSFARGLELVLRGEGRRFKLAVACADGMGGLSEWIPGGLRWVKEFSTESEGECHVAIPFSDLIPSLRAQPLERLPLGLPLRFDAGRITRLQLLHSRFSDDGGSNPGFRAGPIQLDLHGIYALA